MRDIVKAAIDEIPTLLQVKCYPAVEARILSLQNEDLSEDLITYLKNIHEITKTSCKFCVRAHTRAFATTPHCSTAMYTENPYLSMKIDLKGYTISGTLPEIISRNLPPNQRPVEITYALYTDNQSGSLAGYTSRKSSGNLYQFWALYSAREGSQLRAELYKVRSEFYAEKGELVAKLQRCCAENEELHAKIREIAVHNDNCSRTRFSTIYSLKSEVFTLKTDIYRLRREVYALVGFQHSTNFSQVLAYVTHQIHRECTELRRYIGSLYIPLLESYFFELANGIRSLSYMCLDFRQRHLENGRTTTSYKVEISKQISDIRIAISASLESVSGAQRYCFLALDGAVQLAQKARSNSYNSRYTTTTYLVCCLKAAYEAAEALKSRVVEEALHRTVARLRDCKIEQRLYVLIETYRAMPPKDNELITEHKSEDIEAVKNAQSCAEELQYLCAYERELLKEITAQRQLVRQELEELEGRKEDFRAAREETRLWREQADRFKQLYEKGLRRPLEEALYVEDSEKVIAELIQRLYSAKNEEIDSQ